MTTPTRVTLDATHTSNGALACEYRPGVWIFEHGQVATAAMLANHGADLPAPLAYPATFDSDEQITAYAERQALSVRPAEGVTR